MTLLEVLEGLGLFVLFIAGVVGFTFAVLWLVDWVNRAGRAPEGHVGWRILAGVLGINALVALIVLVLVKT